LKKVKKNSSDELNEACATTVTKTKFAKVGAKLRPFAQQT